MESQVISYRLLKKSQFQSKSERIYNAHIRRKNDTSAGNTLGYHVKYTPALILCSDNAHFYLKSQIHAEMKISIFLLSFGFVLGAPMHAHSQTAQTYINKEWSKTKGDLGIYKLVASEVAPNGTIVSVTNHFNGSNTDIYMTCFDEDGNLLWDQTCLSSPTEDDYGTDITVDAAGNIYVTGTCHTGTDRDYYIGKYSSSGALIWEQTYNGGFGEDIPSQIEIAANNDIVVTGSSIGLDTLADFATLRLKESNGSIHWATRYDPEKRQVGISLAFDDDGDVFVTGSAFANQFTSDIVTLKYDWATGAELLEEKLTNPGLGADIPNRIICDGGKVYIAGVMNYGTPNSDGVILCYDNALQLLWRTDIDHAGHADQVNDIIFEANSDRVLVTGALGRTANEQDLFAAAYSMNNGMEAWQYIRPAFDPAHSAEGRSLKAHSSGDLFVTGNNVTDTKDAILIKLSSQGKQIWTRHHDNSQGEDEGHIVDIQGDDIYVFGASENNGVFQASTTKYRWTNRDLTIVHNAERNDAWIKNQFIIEFSSSVLNMSMIDDTGIEYGELWKFLDPGFLASFEAQTEMPWGKYKAYKVHRRASSADSISIARDGHEVHLEDFWASLIVEVPGGYTEFEMETILGPVAKVYSVQQDHIYYFETVPNDTYYGSGQQLGFHANTVYPNSDINIEEAWSISVGRDYIKVGVFDALIDWSHFEFGQSGTLANSTVKGGWDYFYNTDISQGQYVNYSHGTQVAGIIGAQRNEGAGIAGIAGGNLQLNERGVQLFSMGISQKSGQNVYFATSSVIAEAITEGGTQTTNGYGYGLHVQNHSYGTTSYPDQQVKKAIVVAGQNLSVVVAARGNAGNLNLGQTNPASYPACFDDRLVLSVIASGTDGLRKDANTNGIGNWSSSFGKPFVNQIPGCDADFMAPGALQLTATTKATYDPTPNNNACLVPAVQNNSKYSCFNGTSGAAAHVSGVASLLYTHHVPLNGFPNQLGTEDIEEILQKTATDVAPLNYDYESGYGRINAYEALKQVDHPYYVVHKTYGLNETTNNWVASYQNPQINMAPPFATFSDYQPMSFAECFRFVWNISESLPQGHEIIDHWNFEAAWNGGDAQESLVPFISAQENAFGTAGGIWPSIGSNTYSAFAYTFLYRVTDLNNNIFWYPFNPSELRWGFSLHVNTGTMGEKEEEEESGVMNIYPNPTNTEVMIDFRDVADGAIAYMIYDTFGRKVLSDAIPTGAESMKIDVSQLDMGVYYVTLLHQNGQDTEAFIKNE